MPASAGAWSFRSSNKLLPRPTRASSPPVTAARDKTGRLVAARSEIGPEFYSAYIGEVGKRTLMLRLKEHAGGKQWWSRALHITSASGEFNSAAIGWLEGRLYDVLNNAVAAESMNKGRPGDDSLPPQERAILERYVDPIMAALCACGVSPDTADQTRPVPKSQKERRSIRRS